MNRERRITQELKKHDSSLYAKTNRFGITQVFKKYSSLVPYEIDGKKVYCLEPNDLYIFSLTVDWTPKSPVADWGLEPLMRKLRSIDAWNKDSEVHQINKMNEKVDESKARHMKNESEAFASDVLYPAFKKTMGDINTANLNKIDKRRIKDGNRK